VWYTVFKACTVLIVTAIQLLLVHTWARSRAAFSLPGGRPGV